MSEHERKYRAALQAIEAAGGLDALRAALYRVVARADVARAVAAGDEHLNSIALAKWDHVALGRGGGEPMRWGQCWRLELRTSARVAPWAVAWRLGYGRSLSDRICILKALARADVAAGEDGRGEDGPGVETERIRTERNTAAERIRAIRDRARRRE